VELLYIVLKLWIEQCQSNSLPLHLNKQGEGKMGTRHETEKERKKNFPKE